MITVRFNVWGKDWAEIAKTTAKHLENTGIMPSAGVWEIDYDLSPGWERVGESVQLWQADVTAVADRPLG